MSHQIPDDLEYPYDQQGKVLDRFSYSPQHRDLTHEQYQWMHEEASYGPTSASQVREVQPMRTKLNSKSERKALTEYTRWAISELLTGGHLLPALMSFLTESDLNSLHAAFDRSFKPTDTYPKDISVKNGYQHRHLLEDIFPGKQFDQVQALLNSDKISLVAVGDGVRDFMDRSLNPAEWDKQNDYRKINLLLFVHFSSVKAPDLTFRQSKPDLRERLADDYNWVNVDARTAGDVSRRSFRGDHVYVNAPKTGRLFIKDEDFLNSTGLPGKWMNYNRADCEADNSLSDVYKDLNQSCKPARATFSHQSRLNNRGNLLKTDAAYYLIVELIPPTPTLNLPVGMPSLEVDMDSTCERLDKALREFYASPADRIATTSSHLANYTFVHRQKSEHDMAQLLNIQRSGWIQYLNLGAENWHIRFAKLSPGLENRVPPTGVLDPAIRLNIVYTLVPEAHAISQTETSSCSQLAWRWPDSGLKPRRQFWGGHLTASLQISSLSGTDIEGEKGSHTKVLCMRTFSEDQTYPIGTSLDPDTIPKPELYLTGSVLSGDWECEVTPEGFLRFSRYGKRTFFDPRGETYFDGVSNDDPESLETAFQQLLQRPFGPAPRIVSALIGMRTWESEHEHKVTSEAYHHLRSAYETSRNLQLAFGDLDELGVFAENADEEEEIGRRPQRERFVMGMTGSLPRAQRSSREGMYFDSWDSLVDVARPERSRVLEQARAPRRQTTSQFLNSLRNRRGIRRSRG